MKGDLPMLVIKVVFDASTQQFRLLEPHIAYMFDHGDMYLLLVDFFPHDSEVEGQFIDMTQAEIGHA